MSQTSILLSPSLFRADYDQDPISEEEEEDGDDSSGTDSRTDSRGGAPSLDLSNPAAGVPPHAPARDFDYTEADVAFVKSLIEVLFSRYRIPRSLFMARWYNDLFRQDGVR